MMFPMRCLVYSINYTLYGWAKKIVKNEWKWNENWKWKLKNRNWKSKKKCTMYSLAQGIYCAKWGHVLCLHLEYVLWLWHAQSC